MIEKFSERELKQIIKELGLKQQNYLKHKVMEEETQKLKELLREKPDFAEFESANERAYSYINGIVSLSLNSLNKKKNGYYKISPTVHENDELEYKQMFQEILEIIKKHNRKWKSDAEQSE